VAVAATRATCAVISGRSLVLANSSATTSGLMPCLVVHRAVHDGEGGRITDHVIEPFGLAPCEHRPV
jgi:hypothetical protein